MRRTLTVLMLAGAAMALAGCGNGAVKTAAPAARTAAGPRLAVQSSETTSWQDFIAEIATVDQSQVLARIPGILITLNVRAGEMVSRGQVIGRIVDSQLGYQSGAYGARAAAARAQAAQAQA